MYTYLYVYIYIYIGCVTYPLDSTARANVCVVLCRFVVSRDISCTYVRDFRQHVETDYSIV